MPLPVKHEPTPEEIQRVCREIRETWSEQEHWNRAGYRDKYGTWTPPIGGKLLGDLAKAILEE